MKKIISIVIAILLIVLVFMFFYIKSNNNDNIVKMQIIKWDAAYDKKDIKKKIKVKANDYIDLEEFGGNNIEILEINDKNIKISREATRYEIVNQNLREVRKYTETVVENIQYDTLIELDIDSPHPFIDYSIRYKYYIKFIK